MSKLYDITRVMSTQTLQYNGRQISYRHLYYVHDRAGSALYIDMGIHVATARINKTILMQKLLLICKKMPNVYRFSFNALHIHIY